MSIEKFAGLAKGVVKVPNNFMLEGKRVDYGMFYSPHIALPLAAWLAQSMSRSLFDDAFLPVALRSDESSLSGLRLVNTEGEWSSKHLLVLSGAIEELSYPAMKIKGYDYSEMLLKMRDKVISLHKNGEPVPSDSLVLSNHVYAEISPKGLKYNPDVNFSPRK
jgi:hypothetical protein